MATENTLRYLHIDFQSHKDALLQRIRSRWPLIWNDFLSNNIGIVFVDLIAWTTATWAYLLNRVASENFITTATLRESMVRLGALTGYKLHGPLPATVLCEASLSAPADGPSTSAVVKIPKGVIVRTGSGNIPFEVAKDYYVYGGQVTPVTQVAVLDARLSGANVISSNVKVTNGSPYIDLIDTSIDLRDWIEVGQAVRKPRPSADDTVYVIESIESTPGTSSSTYTRLVVSPAWTSNNVSDTEIIPVEVIERRIELIQGQTLTDRFVSPAIETPNFLVKLSQTPVVDNSVSVSVNQDPWLEVPSLLTTNEFQQVFEIKTLASGETLVKFGDGVFGAKIPTDASVVVTYRVGGGTRGNIALNSINTSITGFITSLSNPVMVTITNSTSAGQGGRDAETVEEARVNIPANTKTNDRAVTLEDWQTLSRNFTHPQHGSVAYARASTRAENALLEGNIVQIYAWTTGASGSLVPCSSQLKQSLKEYLLTKSVGTDYPVIADGTERPVPISLRFKTFAGFNVETTTNLVNDQIEKFVNVLTPGAPIIHSNLLRSLDEVYGVDAVTLATPISDLIAANPSELFTAPREEYLYQNLQKHFSRAVNVTIDGESATVNVYNIQLPVSPLAVWSFKLFLGGNELSVISDSISGYARVIGEGIYDGLENDLRSRVNLLTGQTDIVLVGSPGDLTMQLIPVQGYATERNVNVYIGYNGLNTVAKRREIRAALRSWSEGLGIGQSLFASEVDNVTQSRANISAVVEAISGIVEVNRVALDTPANPEDRINAGEVELIRLAAISINNSID